MTHTCKSIPLLPKFTFMPDTLTWWGDNFQALLSTQKSGLALKTWFCLNSMGGEVGFIKHGFWFSIVPKVGMPIPEEINNQANPKVAWVNICPCRKTIILMTYQIKSQQRRTQGINSMSAKLRIHWTGHFLLASWRIMLMAPFLSSFDRFSPSKPKLRPIRKARMDRGRSINFLFFRLFEKSLKCQSWWVLDVYIIW